jgi:quinol monooxygenase YgiN
MIVVIGRVRTDSAKRDELIRIANDVVQASRGDRGCIGYRFYQEMEDEDAYLFVEEWETLEALREHFATSHIATFMQAIPAAIVGAPDVQFHEVSRTMDLGNVTSA